MQSFLYGILVLGSAAAIIGIISGIKGICRKTLKKMKKKEAEKRGK